MLQVSCLCDVTKTKYGDFCVLLHVFEYTSELTHFHIDLIFHTFERSSWCCCICAFGQFNEDVGHGPWHFAAQNPLAEINIRSFAPGKRRIGSQNLSITSFANLI